MEHVTAGGARIPALGFGVMYVTPEQMDRVVPAALEAGIRHFDTAQAYRNEAELGQALERSGMARDALFVTTKIWMENLAPGRFEASLEESLDKLRMDHVDLLLLHWPSEDVPLEDQVAGLDAARASGKTRHVGVSNFTIDWLDRTLALVKSPIVTNQIELHPYIRQDRIVAASHARGLSTTAYFALARERAPKDPVLAEIGKPHDKSAAQVALRWLLQNGHIVLSRTGNPDRVAENAAIFDFALSDAEMARIAALAEPGGRLANFPKYAPDWDD